MENWTQSLDQTILRWLMLSTQNNYSFLDMQSFRVFLLYSLVLELFKPMDAIKLYGVYAADRMHSRCNEKPSCPLSFINGVQYIVCLDGKISFSTLIT